MGDSGTEKTLKVETVTLGALTNHPPPTCLDGCQYKIEAVERE